MLLEFGLGAATLHHLHSVATLTLYGYLGPARSVRTGRLGMAFLEADMVTDLSSFTAWFTTTVGVYLFGAGRFMTLDFTYMSACQYLGTCLCTQNLSATYSFYLVLSALTFYHYLLEAFAWTIMAGIRTNMSTIHSLPTHIVAFWYDSSADYWRTQGCLTAWAWLWLTV